MKAMILHILEVYYSPDTETDSDSDSDKYEDISNDEINDQILIIKNLYEFKKNFLYKIKIHLKFLSV